MEIRLTPVTPADVVVGDRVRYVNDFSDTGTVYTVERVSENRLLVYLVENPKAWPATVAFYAPTGAVMRVEHIKRRPMDKSAPVRASPGPFIDFSGVQGVEAHQALARSLGMSPDEVADISDDWKTAPNGGVATMRARNAIRNSVKRKS